MPKVKKEKEVKASNRWSSQEIADLKRLAAIGLGSKDIQLRMPHRTRTAISNKAAAEEIALDPNLICEIRTHGEKGGVFLREDLGGVVGIRWGCAHRSGGTFPSDMCEGLMAEKVLIAAQRDGLFLWAANHA